MTKILPVITLIIGIVIGVGGYAVYSQQSNIHNKIEHSADHKMIDVDAAKPIPAVQLKATADTMSGINVQLVTQNFKFTPDKVNGENIINEGHAHLMVNGEKLARVYGEWFHIPADKLIKGENIITVTLNANDHSEWAYRGDHIEAQTKVIVQ